MVKRFLLILAVIATVASAYYIYYFSSASWWLQGSVDIGRPAEQQMIIEPWNSYDTIIATIPSNNAYVSDTNFPFKIVIRKTASVENYDYFTLCIGKTEVTECTAPESDAISAAGDDSGILFLFPSVAKISDSGDTAIVNAIMEIPSDAPKDVYGYKIYACAVDDPIQTCDGLMDERYHGDYDFVVEVI